MIDTDQALEDGGLWRFFTSVTVGAGANYSIGLLTASRAVRITSASFQVIGGVTYNADFILYEDTSYTAGTASAPSRSPGSKPAPRSTCCARSKNVKRESVQREVSVVR